MTEGEIQTGYVVQGGTDIIRYARLTVYFEAFFRIADGGCQIAFSLFQYASPAQAVSHKDIIPGRGSHRLVDIKLREAAETVLIGPFSHKIVGHRLKTRRFLLSGLTGAVPIYRIQDLTAAI